MTRTHARYLASCLAASAVAVLVPLALTRQDTPAAGQAPLPTTPCPGCGPTPGSSAVKDFAFAYPEHYCPPELNGSSLYTLRYGYGAQAVGQATFFVSIDGGPPIKLETLKPGESATSPGITVAPGETVTVVTWATRNGKPGGPRVLFGNGQQGREDVLVCDCPVPGEETSTTPPVTAGTSVPGETTTTGPVPVVPSSVSPTSLVGRLPDSA